MHSVRFCRTFFLLKNRWKEEPFLTKARGNFWNSISNKFLHEYCAWYRQSQSGHPNVAIHPKQVTRWTLEFSQGNILDYSSLGNNRKIAIHRNRTMTGIAEFVTRDPPGIDLLHSRVPDVINSGPGLFGTATHAEWLLSRFNSRRNLHIFCVTF